MQQKSLQENLQRASEVARGSQQAQMSHMGGQAPGPQGHLLGQPRAATYNYNVNNLNNVQIFNQNMN